MIRLTILMALVFCSGCIVDTVAITNENSSRVVERCEMVSKIESELRANGVEGAEVAFRSLECLDGGDIEDVYRAIGVQFVSKPRDILAAIESMDITANIATPMLVMLPLSFVDDPCSGERQLLHRREIVSENVSDDEVKIIFFKSLDAAIAKKKHNCLNIQK